jgi:glucose-6-phosphate 1-dehydrogenase
MRTVLVVFGASGDLTVRKLMPALYNNFRKRRLPVGLSIIGFATSVFTDDEFRRNMKEAVQAQLPEVFKEDDWTQFARLLFYQPGNFERSEDYRALREKIAGSDGLPDNCLFYLATAPAFFSVAVARLHEAGMISGSGDHGYRRIVIEKPFGRDLPSAIALNNELHRLIQEDQIYRIDHFLGKETVQNVLVFRFGNAIFEPLWNRNFIDHVQITVGETVGVEHRARYYDKAGVLRDMFQNHLMQLLTLVAMEPPAVYGADALRNEKVKVLSALREIPPEVSTAHTVRGQYEGYRSEVGVDPGSTTETFAALKIHIDNWRWQGVPFYLRSGKMMQKKATEILVVFRRPPTQILDIHTGRTELSTNRLSICIQPDEGFHLRFFTKVPDEGLKTRPVSMDFHYRDSFGETAIPEAYERLLLDALNGDASLFARHDEIELSWEFIDTVRSGWEGEGGPPLLTYERGSWGPEASESLLGHDGRWWIDDCSHHHGTDEGS